MVSVSRRALVGGGAAIYVGGVGGAWWHRAGRALPASFGVTVALRSDAEGLPWRETREVVAAADVDRVVPGSRVLRGRHEAAHLRAQDEWLAGLDLPSPGPASDQVPSVPGDLYAQAALDLWVLGHRLPATVAGWPARWRYVWPRDAAHVAVALSRVGDHAGVVRQLRALDRFVGDAPHLQARYTLDGGVPDARPVQDDGAGWVLWAVDATRGSWVGTTHEAGVRRLARHCTDVQLARLGADGLPAASPDYWEVRPDGLTLGIAAPALVGLERAGRLWAETPGAKGEPPDLPELADRCRSAAELLERRVAQHFGGAGWPREIDGGPSDASVTFMLPPYRETRPGDDAMLAAVDGAAAQMRRDNGGYAPGGGWKQDGVAWTPETALLAAAWQAASAERGRVQDTVAWLARHRTAAGSLPEKVRHDGSPAGPAPLAWTAALLLIHGTSAPA